MPAGCAAHQASEECGLGEPAAGWARTVRLCGLEKVQVEDRGMGVRVEVLADAKLTEVYTVLEQPSNTARCHSQVARDLHHRDPRDLRLERLDDTTCVPGGDQLAGDRVALVAERCLTALPDARHRRVE